MKEIIEIPRKSWYAVSDEDLALYGHAHNKRAGIFLKRQKFVMMAEGISILTCLAFIIVNFLIKYEWAKFATIAFASFLIFAVISDRMRKRIDHHLKIAGDIIQYIYRRRKNFGQIQTNLH